MQSEFYCCLLPIQLLELCNLLLDQIKFRLKKSYLLEIKPIMVKIQRDWNTTFQGTATSNNIFFSPSRDHFLLNGEGGQLTGSITGTYNFFNLFRSRSVEIRQSVLVKNNISNGVIAFKMAGPNEQVDFNLSEINIGMK